MADVTTRVQRAFSAGELTPAIAARADLALFGAGLRTCRNFLVLRGGGVANRGGFRYCGQAGDMTQPVMLYRFALTIVDKSTLIEVGEHYLRFWVNGRLERLGGVANYDAGTAYALGQAAALGGLLYVCIQATTGTAPPNAAYWYPLDGDIYELPTPFSAGAFNSPSPFRFAQDGFEVTITHPGYAPMLLRNVNALDAGGPNPQWSLELLSTLPGVDAPATLTATPGAAGTLNPVYQVTAIAGEPREESLPSDPAICAAAADPTDVLPNALAWAAVADAVEYRVYKDPLGNGTFGYIGTATGQTTFHDAAFIPDYLQTPPIAREPFVGAFNYPALCGYYQQRRLFASTPNYPQGVWTSRVGHPNNFAIRSPLQDDDPVTFRLRAAELHVLRHIIPLKRLILLTNTGEWIVRGDETGALVPTAINPDQYGYVGASDAFPAIVNTSIVYVQARGGVVRDVRFDPQSESALDGRDVSAIAAHLFEGHTIARLEYQQTPHSIVWGVRRDGVLLGCTYLREDDAFGWHRHDTAGGVIEDVCVVPEGTQDVLYAVVRREVNGDTVRYIEKLEPRPVTTVTDATLASLLFLDCGVTKDGAASTTVSGLDHLEGEEVYALADGRPVGPFTVSGGAILLEDAASVVQVGKRITADLETLDLEVASGRGRDALKRVQSLGLVSYASAPGFWAGLDADKLQQQRRESWRTQGVATGYAEVNLRTGFTEHGRVLVRQVDPLPLTILSVIPRFEMGG